jgi:hypothetical protein
MKNTLIQDNFEEISKLLPEDRKVVTTYFENWTESTPAYYEDGDSLQDKYERMFYIFLSDYKRLDSDTVEDLVYSVKDELQEGASYTEYDVETIVDAYHLKVQEFQEWFEELYENNLVESE